MNWFSNISKQSTGLIITDHGIYATTLQGIGDAVRVVGYAHESFPRHVMDNGHIHDESSFIYALQRIKKRLRISAAHVGIPENHGHTYVVSLPAYDGDGTHEEHINRELVSHIQHHTDHGENPGVCEYDIVATHPHGIDVAVTIIPQGYVSMITRIIGRAGIEPLSIEKPSPLVVNTFVQTGTHMVVDFGRHTSHAMVVHDGHIIESTSFDIGTHMLIDYIGSALNISPVEANSIFQRHGVSRSHREQHIYQGIREIFSDMIHHIDTRVIDWHQQLYAHARMRTPLRNVWIYGAGAATVGLTAIIGNHARITTDTIDVWGYPSFKNSQKSVPIIPAQEMPVYTSAIAIALQGFGE